MLNRSAVIIRPARPFIDWAAALDDSGIAPDPNGEQTVYLISIYDDDEEAWEILEDIFPTIFENELHSWHMDESAWPPDRTFRMFKEWFKVELHSVVEDLCSDDIIDEEDGED